ncbi:MAG TPA: DUF1015 domain-containing protein [Firmicutes bacterium]|nr:DUF1015 domain-containing protein [Bacillota bacterium]
MIKVFPFRGIRYNAEKIGDLSEVVTQPYDKIDDKLMETYYKRHPNNFTRIIKARVEPDTHEDNRYIRARNYMHEWFNTGILARDQKPAIYPYYQEYTIDNVTRVRKGVTLLVNLRETEVKAHEKTLEGPKADRLNLQWATGSQTGHIFILYPDPEGKINAILDKTASSNPPIAEALDDFDCRHKLWTITDQSDISRVQEILKPHDLFIADGHHRTETARNYMKAMDLIGLDAEGNEIPENCLMTLISMDDPGLVVLPTHRYVHSVPEFDKHEFLRRAGENFDETEISFPETSLSRSAIIKTELEKAQREGKHAVAVYFKDDTAFLLVLRSEKVMKALLPGDRSDTWRNLDVNVLHVALLEDILGIDAEKLAQQTNVKYYREIEEGLSRLADDPNGNALFAMNATKVSEVKDVAMAGERMPQKSTDFFPKLIDGMIFNKIRFIGWKQEAGDFFSL